MSFKSLCRTRLAGVFTGLLPLVVAASAKAQTTTAPNCSDLAKPVYVGGSTAVKPFLGGLAADLVGLSGADQITIVYVNSSMLGSCDGVDGIVTPGRLLTGTGNIWGTDGKEVSGGCNLPTDGVAIDIGFSDVFPATCPGKPVLDPTVVKDFLGPVQTMTFAVPKMSTQASISAEAAYLTFGFPNGTGGSPWSDPTKYFIRGATSGTRLMLATAIKVPGNWQGVQKSGSGDVVNALSDIQSSAVQADADLGIGILATAQIEGSTTKGTDKVANRSFLRALPYQHYGQTCGYLPDSTSESKDKQNVRDGHYMVWGPLHMLTHVAAGVAVNPNAQKVIDTLNGSVAPSFDLIQVEAKGGVIPDCAMHVSRDEEVGPLSSYMPPHSCECKFVKEATGVAPTECTACTASTDCPSPRPVCNYGFCEVQ